MALRNHTAGLLAALLLVACGGSEKKTAPTGLSAGNGSGTTEPAVNELDQPTPMDPLIRKGVLANGLTYYVMQHKQPQQRAQLWLGVNAGSNQEDDDQQGLAHFVEHMAFNGTENFKKDAIVNYFESIGMQFGPDLNAYTSFDETVYMIQVPTDNQKTVDSGMAILRDWAQGISFEPVEVDKERGVVTEEWRLRRGAGERVRAQQYPVIYKNSRYADRLPIGKVEILKNAPVDALVRYYKDWYRPNLMAVVAVGDFDAAAMEAQIKKTFGDLKNPEKQRAREPVPVPDHDETLVTIATDKELPRSTVQVMFKHEPEGQTTLRDYRNGLIRSRLFSIMLNARLGEIRERPDSPFLFAFAGDGEMVRTKSAFRATALAKEGKIEESLATLWEEIERLKRHGFTASELERARKDFLRGSEQSAIEVKKQQGRELAAEFLRNFFEAEQVPGRVVEYEYAKRFVPEITLEELNGLIKTFTAPTNRVIAISGPEKSKATQKGTMPDEARTLAILKEVEAKEIAAYSDEVSDQPLMTVKPAKGAVTGESKIAELGVTEWMLSNGARVVVKSTDFQNDEIQLSAFSPGGSSLLKDKDYPAARSAGGLIGFGGVGEFNRTQLGKLLAGKVASASAFIGELEEGLRGRASPRDLETMLQLVHLRFTAPRKDAEAFKAWKSQEIEFVRNRRLSPEGAFRDDAAAAFSKNHLRRRPMTLEDIEKVDLDKSYNFYRDRFGDAGDFTFTFVGNVDLTKLKPLVELYLASLPAAGRKEKWRDVRVRHPTGVKKTTVKRGSEPKSYVFIRFHGSQKWSEEAANDMRMLSETLRMRLREIMREDLGGVYGVSSFGGVSRRPTGKRTFGIYFGCDPDRIDELTKAAFAEIKNIQKNGIGEEYIAKIKTIRTRQHEVALRRNRFWVRELQDAYRYGDDPRQILEHKKWVDAVSSKRIQAAAKRFIRMNQYHTAVLVPEKIVKKADAAQK